MFANFNIKSRKAQSGVELSLLAFITTLIIVVILRESISQRRVSNKGFCLPSGEPAHRATDNLLKRTFEYYFNKRVEVNFVFSPVALQRSMINLAYSTESTELRNGLNLPCDIADFEKLELEEHLDRVSNRAYLRELRSGMRLTERFIQFAKLNLTTDVFDTEKKFHLSLASSEEEDLAHFGHSVNYATFFAHDEHDDETVLSIGSKMTMGHNEDRTEFGKGSVVITEATRREFPFYCFDLYTVPLDGHPGNYNIGLLTNRTNCTFLDASKSVAAVDVGSIFPPNATTTTPGGSNATTQDESASRIIRVPLFDLATYISLNLPMQSFNIVGMFDPEKATFKDVVDCSIENERLTVRDVVQESRIHLTSDLFNANVSGDHDPSGGFFDFCGRKMLFLVRNMDTGEVVLFGRKDHTDNKCE